MGSDRRDRRERETETEREGEFQNFWTRRSELNARARTAKEKKKKKKHDEQNLESDRELLGRNLRDRDPTLWFDLK